MNIEQKVRTFIMGNLLGMDGEEELQNDDNYFELGFVNSLFAMKLVNYIENEFDITVENDEIDIENFNTIDHITAYVSSKLKNN